MNLWEALQQTAANEDYVREWARLRGVTFPGNPIERMVDEATGHSDSIAALFIGDFIDMVWFRVPRKEDA
jgi:hypothetical protein